MYSSRTFGRLTGITQKSLRHYERVGILAPTRTAGGYRRYSSADVARIHKTLALKSLGFPLKTIKAFLDGQAIDLVAQRERLIGERDRLAKIIDELSDQPASAGNIDAFVAQITWDRVEATRLRHALSTPRPPDRACESRRAAFHEVATALEIDPTGQRTRELAEAFRRTSDPDAQSAVKNRTAWPLGMRQYIASLYDANEEMWERVISFVELLPSTGDLPRRAV